MAAAREVDMKQGEVASADRAKRGRMVPAGPRGSWLDKPRSLLFYLVFYLGTLVLLFIGGPLARLVPRRMRFVCDGWSHWHRWCVTHILRIKVVVEGTMPSGAVLVAARHEAFFEAIDMPTLIDYPAVFAKVELMRLPLWGRLGAAYGLVAVERDQGARALRAMVAAARRLSAEGRVLVIFPEGTRVPHGETPELQSGFAGLYKLLGLPVVPLAVNSGPVYHGLWKKKGTITYRFGETIPAGLPREEVEQRVRAAMFALT